MGLYKVRCKCGEACGRPVRLDDAWVASAGADCPFTFELAEESPTERALMAAPVTRQVTAAPENRTIAATAAPCSRCTS